MLTEVVMVRQMTTYINIKSQNVNSRRVSSLLIVKLPSKRLNNYEVSPIISTLNIPLTCMSIRQQDRKGAIGYGKQD